MEPYDALLLVSFGGPEGPDDVLPFLENVTRGRDVPAQRLAEVGAHYHEFGGRSPINDQCRALRDAISADLSAHGIELPVYWGNRNWHPYLADTLRAMHDDGVRRAACLVTSAYSSYSGCRQYREDLFDAVAPLGGTTTGIGAGAPRLDRLRHYFNHPGFVQPFVDGTVAALQRLHEEGGRAVRLAFVTHSIPAAMNAASGDATGNAGGAYVRQHDEVARVVTEQVGERIGQAVPYDLVYCSRSGSPRVPWLEPDVADHLADVAAAGADAVVVVPIGFVSDHMEVIWDLDTEAAAAADRCGLGFARVPTPGTDPRFVAMVRDLLVERATVERGAAAEAGRAVDRAVVGRLDPSWDACPVGCCANPRGERPAVGGIPLR